MRHIISAIVENKPGVLARIIGLISGRGYNIESLNVAPSQDVSESRLTIIVPGDDKILQQVTKQLNKLIDVIKVTDLTKKKSLDRELILVEVNAPPKRRAEVIELAGLCEAEIVSVQTNSLTVQLVAEHEKINDFFKLLKTFTILDISRTGEIAIARG